MTTLLKVYNTALLHLRRKPLQSATANSDDRLKLDVAYESALPHCLAQSFWNFAMRSVALSADTGINPAFGYSNAFAKPSDWVRTYRICSEDTMTTPANYSDENGLWYSNVDPLYVQYVSNDDAYGGDLTLWTQHFADYVSLRLAFLCAGVIEGTGELAPDIERRMQRAFISATGKDGMDEAAKYPPRGSWASARSSSFPRIRS